MLKIISTGCLILFFTLTTVQVQDDIYYLYQPTPADYLHAIPSILDAGNQAEIGFNALVYAIIIEELSWFYSDTLATVDTDVFYDALRHLILNQMHPSLPDRDVLITEFLVSWFNQNHINLNETETLKIYDFDITITPRDYNGDGASEWLLHVNIDADTYIQHTVITHQGEQYQSVKSPLPWLGCCFEHTDTRSGVIEEQYFGDMTGDDIPEWVLAMGGIGGIGMTHINTGWLYILQWQDGELINITPDFTSDSTRQMTYRASSTGVEREIFPQGVTVRYDDTDDNGTVEVIIEQVATANSQYNGQQTRIFSFTGEHFELINRGAMQNDVKNETTPLNNVSQDYTSHFDRHMILSAVRQAIQEDDYSEALHIIEFAIHRGDISENDYAGFRYVRARLLELYNHPDEALNEYVTLLTSEPESAWGLLAALHVHY